MRTVVRKRAMGIIDGITPLNIESCHPGNKYFQGSVGAAFVSDGGEFCRSSLDGELLVIFGSSANMDSFSGIGGL